MKTRAIVWSGISFALLMSGALGTAADGSDTGSGAFEYDELKQLIADSRAARVDFLEARRVLRSQLAETTTLEERRVLLRRFWEDHRDVVRAQRTLRRQFHHRRLEIRRHRRNR